MLDEIINTSSFAEGNQKVGLQENLDISRVPNYNKQSLFEAFFMPPLCGCW